jgi:hypothetical protein
VVASTSHLLGMYSVQESQSVVAHSGLPGGVLSQRAGFTRTDAQRRRVCESCLSTHAAAAPTRSAGAALAASRIFAHHLVLQVHRFGPHQMPALLHTHANPSQPCACHSSFQRRPTRFQIIRNNQQPSERAPGTRLWRSEAQIFRV